MEMENYGGDSFFSDSGNDGGYSSQETQQQASPAPESGQQPQTQQQDYVSRQEYDQIQQNYQRQQQAMEEFANRIAGRQPANDPNAVLGEFVKDPNAWTSQTIQQQLDQRFQEFAQQQTINQAVERLRGELPHLAPFEQAILSPQNIQAAQADFQKQNGRLPNIGYETGKAAADYFQRTALNGWQQISPQTQQQMQQARQNTIPMHTVGSPQLNSTGKPDFRNMSDADFVKYQSENRLHPFQ